MHIKESIQKFTKIMLSKFVVGLRTSENLVLFCIITGSTQFPEPFFFYGI